MDYFDELLKMEILRDEMIDICISKIQMLNDKKIKIIFDLLKTI